MVLAILASKATASNIASGGPSYLVNNLRALCFAVAVRSMLHCIHSNDCSGHVLAVVPDLLHRSKNGEHFIRFLPKRRRVSCTVAGRREGNG